MTCSRLPTVSTSLALLLLGAGACGGGGVSFQDLPDRIESDTCKSDVKCNAYPDLATCKDVNFPGASDFPQIEADINAGLVNYDSGKAQDCLDALKNDSCNITDLLVDNSDAIDETCNKVFTGTVEDGGACTNDLQCAGDNSICDTGSCNMACCQGTCMAGQAQQKAGIGEDCSEADCVSGAYCQQTMTGATCAEKVGQGETCDSFSACKDGSFCEIDFMTGSGTCEVPAARGETCDPQRILPCNNVDDFCDPADTTCKPRKDVGEECTAQPDNCVAYAYCNSGTCAMLPVEGEDCNPDAGQDCLGSLECNSGKCQAPQANDVCPIEGA